MDYFPETISETEFTLCPEPDLATYANAYCDQFEEIWPPTSVETAVTRGKKLRECKASVQQHHKYRLDVDYVKPFADKRRSHRNCYRPCYDNCNNPCIPTHCPPCGYCPNTSSMKCNYKKNSHHNQCPVRIIELAAPSKRHCLDTWRNQSHVLPDYMLDRIRQYVMDERPVVQVPDAFNCFKKRVSNRSSKSSKCKANDPCMSDMRRYSAIFAHCVAQKLDKPLNITLNPELEKISKIVSYEISRVASKKTKKGHIQNKKRNKFDQEIQDEMSKKVTAWINNVLEDTTDKILQDDLRELEEEEGPVLDIIDDLIDSVVTLCEPDEDTNYDTAGDITEEETLDGRSEGDSNDLSIEDYLIKELNKQIDNIVTTEQDDLKTDNLKSPPDNSENEATEKSADNRNELNKNIDTIITTGEDDFNTDNLQSPNRNENLLTDNFGTTTDVVTDDEGTAPKDMNDITKTPNENINTVSGKINIFNDEVNDGINTELNDDNTNENIADEELQDEQKKVDGNLENSVDGNENNSENDDETGEINNGNLENSVDGNENNSENDDETGEINNGNLENSVDGNENNSENDDETGEINNVSALYTNSEEPFDDMNKTVKFSKVDDDLGIDDFILENQDLSELRNEDKDKHKTTPSIQKVFASPNQTLLNKTDEKWPSDINVSDGSRCSANVSKSIMSLGLINENVDDEEKQAFEDISPHADQPGENTFVLQSKISNVQGKTLTDNEKAKIQEIRLQEDQESQKLTADQMKYLKTSAASIQLFEQPILTGNIEKDNDYKLGSQKLHSINEIIQSVHTFDQISDTEKYKNINEVESPTTITKKTKHLKTGTANSSQILEDKSDKDRKYKNGKGLGSPTLMTDETKMFKSGTIQPVKTFDNKSDNAVLPNEKVDYKVDAQTAPSWVVSDIYDNGSGEPEDSLSKHKHIKKYEINKSDVQIFAKNLEITTANLLIWSDWIDTTCRNVNYTKRKSERNRSRSTNTYRRKDVHHWMKLDKCIRKDAHFWLKFKHSEKKKLKAYQNTPKQYDGAVHSVKCNYKMASKELQDRTARTCNCAG